MLSKTVLLFVLLVQTTLTYRTINAGRAEVGKRNKVPKKEQDTLILTNVVFRHGDRTPDSTTIYPNDPYVNETYFPFGVGQLTLQGKKNSFHLGQLLRQRYSKFVGPVYSSDIVESFSSNYPRTQMTLQAVHAALFPPTQEYEIEEGFNWQPIPYTYYSAKDDYLIATYRSCDLLYWLTDDIEKTPEYREILKEFDPTYEYVSEHAGWTVNNTRFAFFTYNSLKTESEWGFKLPEWTDKIYPEPIKSASSWFWKLVTSTPQLRRISIGNLLKKILMDSEAKAQGTLKPALKKMFIYSGHDFTVVPIMAALGHYDGEELPYTTHIMFELHKINGTYGFKIFVQDYKQEEPRLLKVHDCEEFCPLSQFRLMFEDHFPGSEWCGV